MLRLFFILEPIQAITDDDYWSPAEPCLPLELFFALLALSMATAFISCVDICNAKVSNGSTRSSEAGISLCLSQLCMTILA